MMKEMTLNEIKEKYPNVEDLMDKYGMDKEVGGLDTLAEAAMILGLSVATIDYEFTNETFM